MKSTFTQWVGGPIRIGTGNYLPCNRVLCGSWLVFAGPVAMAMENVLILWYIDICVFRAVMACFALFSVADDIIFILSNTSGKMTCFCANNGMYVFSVVFVAGS